MLLASCALGSRILRSAACESLKLRLSRFESWPLALPRPSPLRFASQNYLRSLRRAPESICSHINSSPSVETRSSAARGLLRKAYMYTIEGHFARCLNPNRASFLAKGRVLGTLIAPGPSCACRGTPHAITMVFVLPVWLPWLPYTTIMRQPSNHLLLILLLQLLLLVPLRLRLITTTTAVATTPPPAVPAPM